jgi:DNA-directed RNA polymerase sigma subunit (sigma70/sigma32)
MACIVRIGRDAREQLTSVNLRLVVWIAPPRHRARGQAAHLAELDGASPDRAVD